MRAVVWSSDALDDLGDMLDFYAAFDEAYALRLISEIDAAALRLGEYPTGRPGRNAGTFEKSLPRLNYIIAYEVGPGPEGDIGIVRVIHSSQNWPKDSWPE